MKIAYVTMQFPSPSETFAGADVRTLAAQGADVTVFAMRPRIDRHDALLVERSLERIDVRPLDPRRALAGLALVATRPRWAWSLLAWIVRWQGRRPNELVRSLALAPGALAILRDVDRSDFDVVHLFWGHYPAMVGHLVARFRPDIVVTTFLGAYDLRAGYPGSRPVAAAADAVWTHVAANAPAILELGVRPDRLHVCYRGIDVPHALRIVAEERERRVAHRLAAVGRLTPAKGMDDVLHALVEVRRQVPDATLVIAGDGPDRGRLEGLVDELGLGEAVAFLGHLPQEAAWREMARSDAFVLMSHEERLPNAAKEAMALGCATIVTRTVGIDELVEDGRTGYVVEPKDRAALAARLLATFTADEAARSAMRAAALAHVAQHFDVGRSMATYLATWRKLVDERRAR